MIWIYVYIEPTETRYIVKEEPLLVSQAASEELTDIFYVFFTWYCIE